ncbi:unnamed protein product [Microthlaspi erraticum]|uniref:F-box associated beta-propeller type 3 domain-containing protein n=1 Tax=Microthlaspi erraticum TaxID=1685480 RepID=A0A6D2KBF4_9BRAS|nr:unnamed protein product [Microthlaspi erraticum]
MTLGTGKLSWRLVEIDRVLHYTPSSVRRYKTYDEICINGVVYYPFARRDRKTYIIVCFDVRSEKLSFIKVKEALCEAVLCGTLINYNGKLGLLLCKEPYVLHKRSRSFKLWVLEDLEKQSWSEHLYLLPALWENVVGDALLRFVGATLTNEIVFSSSNCPYGRFYLFYLNIERNSIVRVEGQGMDVSKGDRVLCTSLDHVEDVKLM